MSLRWKFFLSYLVVIGLALLVVVVATVFLAPEQFSGEVAQMRMEGMMGRGSGRIHNTMMGDVISTIEEDLNVNFRKSVNSALLLAGIVAIVAAAEVSWVLSQRVIRPLKDVSKASQHISAGHYEDRLPVDADDELGELIQNFNRMAAALAQTESMRQQLIADVSHELKTPLASIKGYMEGLQDGVIRPSPETFQLVHQEADRLQRLVHDLQELSRAEADQLQLDISQQDANALVTSAVEWLRPQFDDKGIALTFDPMESPVLMLADFDRTRQVLLNLLGNALQYTPPGGQAAVRVTRQGDQVQFAVSDTGIGIAAVEGDQIFQRFYRVDKSRSRVSGGSGIGLTIARHIVTAQGGRIWVESAGQNRGSTFIFTLPAA
jgi:signal transduction histidine kinase